MRADALPLHDLYYERVTTTPVQPWCLTVTFLGILVCIASGGVVVFCFAWGHGQSLGLFALRAMQPPREEPLPSRFVVPERFLVPNHPQAEPGLAFAATYYLESSYRARAVADGQLAPSQFIRFNQTELASSIVVSCENQSSPVCAPNDDLIVWTRPFNVFPISASNSHRSNPLRFSVTRTESVGSINLARRRLLARQAPLIFWMPSLQKRFWVPNDECLDRCFGAKCPVVFGVDSDVVDDQYSEIVAGPRTTLPLIGYTDDGFVVRNNWGAVGHRLEYLFGEMSADMDRRACPNPRDVSQWVPADLACIKNMTGWANCSRDLHWICGNATFGARNLTCHDETFCHKSATYFMSRGKSGFVLDGSSFPEVIEVFQNGTVGTTRIQLPVEFLSRALWPTAPTGKRMRCGHVLLPYSLMKKIAGMRLDTADGWRVFDVGVEWSDDSFPGRTNALNYTELGESIADMESPDWNDWIEPDV
jgi:hypothetical protein